ncbi:MAG: translation elongation factor Ts [Candidatus Tectomicrobia bacterium]|jgi:elongation factor Ts|nr:translation elongation factor Ts [Candidatus Tectomicrobia bacterium]
MAISADMVKELREKTGAGMMDCKRALSETEGDIEKAIDYLRQKGLSDAAKRTGRTASEGVIGSYIHPGGKIGVLVEVNCESDFVARTEEFQLLVKDLAMHVAASNPLYLRREDVPEEAIAREKNIYEVQAKEGGKPEKIVERIVQGKLEKFFQDVCLLEQPFVKDPDLSVNQRVSSAIAKLGENIVVRRFQRFQLGGQ